MDRRIRIVWATALAAILLLILGQGYWLAEQVRYESIRAARSICRTVDSLSSLEQQLRYARNSKHRADTSNRMSVSMNVAFGLDPDSVARAVNSWRITLARATDTIIYAGEGLTTQQVALMSVRYARETAAPFGQSLLDSLLATRGLRLLEPPRCDSLPTHSFESVCLPRPSLCRPSVEVVYPANPLLRQARRMHIAVPWLPVLKQMAGQTAGSLLLVALLVCCVGYQLKTILFQRRIDAIRCAFIKNMLYEMKAPPADSDVLPEDGIRLGQTNFFYSLNELHTPAGTVIITARQAEILKLLAENHNRTVLRSTLLSEVWGDDSYQNSMALNVQISYLRRALRSDPSLSIEVVTKKGYLLAVRS